ncbi:MAG: DUF2141 domain-containing protein [Bacteroidia bacterium]|jgi:uncharacterized protein (DUF2141 family)|nr:DUF2141 domain-containing protein [Bacteroidia bacterium]
MKYLILAIAFSSTLLLQSFKSPKYTVELTISNLRNFDGEIGIGIYQNDDGFQNEQSYINKKFSKAQTKNGRLTVTFTIEAGTYGIALLDDENKNNKMDYSFIGIPKEGFGFSNYYHTGLTKPHFNQFKFEVKPNTKNTVEVKVRYI